MGLPEDFARVQGRSVDPVLVPRVEAGADTLEWVGCPTAEIPTLQCARLLVPRDYAKPRGRKFSIAVVRIPATGPASDRRGPLVFNPGGPGGSGTASIASVHSQLGEDIRSRFDLVSFDPRGIGETVPALTGCAQPWSPLPATGRVNWNSARDAAARQLARANAECQRLNRDFIGTMGTVNVVRDLDRLRRALGRKKLAFWGMSYGTRIGFTYAVRYPHRVGALVLDGNIDPTNSKYVGLTEGAIAPDKAFSLLSRLEPQLYGTIMNTRDALASEPLQLNPGETPAVYFTRWDYLNVMAWMTGAQRNWPGIANVSQLAAWAREDSDVGAESRVVLRSLVSGPNTNQGAGFSVVNCLDYANWPGARQQRTAIRRSARQAPIFGGVLATDYAIGCSGLKLKPTPVPQLNRYRSVVRSLKVIVSNATHDTWTPLIWARRMVDNFPSGRMVTYRGTQHVIWQLVASRCVDSPISRYAVTRRVPAGRIDCPFAPMT